MRKHQTPAEDKTEQAAQKTAGEPTEADAATEKIQAEMAALTEKVHSLTDENAQLKDQLMRTMADMQNFRKRAAQEKIALTQYASEELVTELLPVLDNFERTLAAVENGASLDSVVEGVRATERQLRTVLESKNLSRIPSEGVEFDPDLHHALAMHVTEEIEEGTVTHELEAGYKLADKVIRPAKVKVAKKP